MIAAPTPRLHSAASLPPGEGRTLLLAVAHGDDPALFLGASLALWSRRDWRLVVLRVTDDRWDSVGLDEAETIVRNRAEFEQSCRLLGVAETVHLDWQTDVLADCSRVALRERIIHALRRFRPYALVGFDPYAMFGEDNQDHRVLAQAADEACWTAQFDKHHPEHFDQGLRPHGVFERWYFGRAVMRVSDVIDTSTTLERQIEAALCHRTMLTHIAHQMVLQAGTGGWQVELAERAQSGDPDALAALFSSLLRHAAKTRGERYGLAAADEFRVLRYAGLGDWLAHHGRRRAAAR